MLIVKIRPLNNSTQCHPREACPRESGERGSSRIIACLTGRQAGFPIVVGNDKK